MDQLEHYYEILKLTDADQSCTAVLNTDGEYIHTYKTLGQPGENLFDYLCAKWHSCFWKMRDMPEGKALFIPEYECKKDGRIYRMECLIHRAHALFAKGLFLNN